MALGFVDIFGSRHPSEQSLGSLPENVIGRSTYVSSRTVYGGKAGGCILLPKLDATMEKSVQREISA